MSHVYRLLLLVLGAAACAEASAPSPGPTGLGAIGIQIVSRGSPIDPDGYTVLLDDFRSARVRVQDSLALNNLRTGRHTLRLVELASDCFVTTPTPQIVEVPAGGSAMARFDVFCVPPAVVTVATTGTMFDRDGYILTLSGPGVVSVTLPANGTVLVHGLKPGAWQLTLTGVAANCGVAAIPPQVSIDSSITSSLRIDAQCTTASGQGQMRVTVSTTMIPAAPPGFSFGVSLDGNPSGSVPANGSVTLTGIAAGTHSVHLSVPHYCGSGWFGPPLADQSVTLWPGSVANVQFNVFCLG